MVTAAYLEFRFLEGQPTPDTAPRVLNDPIFDQLIEIKPGLYIRIIEDLDARLALALASNRDGDPLDVLVGARDQATLFKRLADYLNCLR